MVTFSCENRTRRTPALPGSVQFVVPNMEEWGLRFDGRHNPMFLHFYGTCTTLDGNNKLGKATIGGPAAPKPLCFPGGLRPPDPSPSSSSNMSPIGHDTCSVIIVHARTMIIVRACTMIIMHACTMIIVHACTMIIVHACTVSIVHACAMIIVHACNYYDHSTCMYYGQMYYKHTSFGVAVGHNLDIIWTSFIIWISFGRRVGII